jgi:hypothetical protein
MVQRGHKKSGELDAALDQASEQPRDMSRDEVVDQEDLAWSFPSGVSVEPEVLSSEPLVVRLEASTGVSLRRVSASRTIQLSK